MTARIFLKKGMEYMEIRKIQMTGRSSFVLTLPKNWVDSLEIQKNDPLGVIIQSDGNLLITKNISGEKIQRTKNIEVHQKTDPVFFLSDAHRNIHCRL